MRKMFFLPVVFLLFVSQIPAQENISEGSLFAISRKDAKEIGACPLKSTKVTTDISGFLARVTVVQEFENSFTEPIEAVYTFPLSQNGAVDDMTMRIGERVIRGRIMKREEARKVYEDAKNEGRTTSLLDQQRPNIFTQSVANILPGEKIIVEISYVETLKYDEGNYEFVFPMTVAPRYVPSSVKAADAQNITPVIAAERAGHNISIEVNLNAGVPVEAIRSDSHDIETVNLSAVNARISLKTGETIPNKDFILRYDVTGKRIEDAVLSHRSEKGGFFTVILAPPDNFGTRDVTPKEIVFVLDTSGSMNGFPIEKAKEAINLSLDGLYPNDTFNLITFAGDTAVLFDAPVPATQANIERAREFLESRSGGGGTEMMTAIKAALEPTASQTHVRIVCFMTDGLVGNEDEIIAEVQKHQNARVFSFGIGNSVNRFLLDKIAAEGRGEAEYVSLTDDGSKAARKFYERVRAPLLTDISVEWNGLPVTDVYPSRIGDLFSAKPVVLHGRYTNAAKGTIRLKGKVGGQDYVREIAVDLPEAASENNVLATLWARTRIDELISKSMQENGRYPVFKEQTKNEIIDVSLKYNLLTRFTSFVAVEERVKTRGGKIRRVEVPVEKADGVNIPPGLSAGADPYGFIFQTTTGRRNSRKARRGGGDMIRPFVNVDSLTLTLNQSSPNVISTGVINGRAINLVKPSYPAAAKAVNAGGAVNVQVVIDEQGNVISATAVSGHPLLRAAAVNAARQSKFSPTMLAGQPVKVTGVIAYNFTDSQPTVEAKVDEVTVENRTSDVVPPTISPEMQAERERLEKERRAAEQLRAEQAKYRQMLAEKLHFWVFALFERWQKGETAPGVNDAKFVSAGQAGIEVHLTANTAEVVEKLKNAGFETLSGDKAILVGKIQIEKLAKLAEIAEVRYIFPALK